MLLFLLNDVDIDMTTKQEKKIIELQQENRQLKKEVSRLRSKTRILKGGGRRALKWASFGLAGAVFVAASAIFYVGMTLTNTDRFMRSVGPLIQQPAIQEAVAKKTTDALFAQIDTVQLATEVLPDKIDFLAPQVAREIQNASTNEAQKILASPSFQGVWDKTLRTAHQNLVNNLRSYKGNGTISVNDVYNQLSAQLETTKLNFLTGKQLPSNIGEIVVVQADYLPVAHTVVSNMSIARVISIVLVLGLFSLSIYLSDNRRKTIIHIGILVAALSVFLLVSLRIGQEVLVNSTQASFRQAASETWKIVFQPYSQILWGQVVLGLSLSFVSWIGGNSKTATKTRSRLQVLVEGNAHKAIFNNQDPPFSKWIRQQRMLLMSLVLLGFLLSLLFISISLSSVILASLISLAIILVLFVLGGPSS